MKRLAWTVLAAWAAVVACAIPVASSLQVDSDERNWMAAGSGSVRAVDLQQREFPSAATLDLQVIYAREAGLTAADHAAVAADRGQLQAMVGVPVPPAAAATDGKALMITVPVPAADAVSAVSAVRAALARHDDGLLVRTAGPAASRADASSASGAVDGKLLAVTIAVVALVLLVTYRSLMLILLPLICVGVATIASQACIAVLAATTGLVVTGTGTVVLTVLVYGVGTDYALLLMSRYREETRQPGDRSSAMVRTLRATTTTIAASAATVTAALMLLVLARMNSTRGLGPVAAVGVVMSALTMTTLLPALLLLAGRVAARSRRPAVSSMWTRVAQMLPDRRRQVWLLCTAGLLMLTLGVLAVSFGPNQGAAAFTRPPEFAAGQQLLARHFPAGNSAPAQIFTPAARQSEVSRVAQTVPGIARVLPARLSADGTWALVDVILTDDPDSPTAGATIARLRSALDPIDPAAAVGGRTAAGIDERAAMRADLRLLVPAILAAIALIVGLQLRSVTASLLSLGCVLVSSAAGLGVAGLILAGIGHPHIDLTALLLGFVFVVALGVDYTIFLMSRARQEARTRGHSAGVLTAVLTTGSVITSAGIVLAATFAVLTATPVVLNLQLGVLVAVSVLLDTFVVRGLLLPALALDLGQRTWWPTQPGNLGRRRSGC